VDTIADRIGYVHLKNVRRAHGCASGEFWCTPLKSGDINNYQFMKMILSHRYDGIVTIENTMSGDKREFMHEDLAYLKNILDDLGT
jgi:sugar phosphate isomerase/epimerase